MEPIEKQLNKYQLSDDRSLNKTHKQPPIGVVDQLAAELIKEFQNPTWLKWYCGVIYEFGPSKVEEWRRRSLEGKTPAKLFTFYVTQARKYKNKLVYKYD